MTMQNAVPGNRTESTAAVPAQTEAEASFQDNLRLILEDNVGSYMTGDFLVGTDTLVARQGILEFVGPNFIVLHDETCGAHIVGDLDALRFISVCFSEEEETGPNNNATQQNQLQSQQQAQPQPFQSQFVNRMQGQSQNTQPQPASTQTAQTQHGAQAVQTQPQPPQPSNPLTGVQSVSSRPQAQAAFNYAKRKARR